MNYPFPNIGHIDTVLRALQGRTSDEGGEFLIGRRDGYVFIDYVYVVPDSFPDPMTAPDQATAEQWAIRRECRGITFCSETGFILRRPFQKFFNLDQKPETLAAALDFTRPHVFMEKLDGSMVAPFRTRDGVVRWATRMGETHVSKQAAGHASLHPTYQSYVEGCLDSGTTPIFEWCSARNKVVAFHPEDRLVLTAVRDNLTGHYLDYDSMTTAATPFGIPVAAVDTPDGSDPQDMLATTAKRENTEGRVVRFHGGHMVKVKTSWYLAIHHATSNVIDAEEKDILGKVLMDEVDDLYQNLPLDLRAKLEAYDTAVKNGITCSCEWAAMLVQDWRVRHPGADRKKFAAYVKDLGLGGIPAELLFQTWSGANTQQWTRQKISSLYLGSQTRVDLIRPVIGGARWTSVWENATTAP